MDRSTQKKKAILDSATRVFSEKGFAYATVSEIARGADLGPTAIYTYFKSKEAVLFSVIDHFLTACHSGMKEHLQGIAGAENKLRKAIWFHCKVYSGNKNEIKIILESRSYPRFYASKAYSALKRYAGLITAIIEEGISDGSFVGLSSPMILRDMILGTVDHIAINWTLKDSPKSLDQAETIADMVLSAVRPDPEKARILNKKDEKKNRIINAALALFAENGFNDTSMLEIARKADVAEGTVYEYYSGKENLLISIPDEKLGRLYDLVRGNSLEAQIAEIISRIFKFYNEEREYTTILVLMLRTNRKFHHSRSIRIIEKIFEEIRRVIVKGQQENIFRKDLDWDICENLLFGTIDHIIIPWIIFNRNYDMPTIGEEVSHLFIDAIRV